MNKKLIFETFSDPTSSYIISNIKQDEPSCFNGIIRVKKYRVTIEEIKEPKEFIQKRIQTLWDNCSNHHHRIPLREAAKEVGLEL